MTTLSLEWDGDLVLSTTGSAQVATGWDEIRQRIIRRIFTNSAQTLPDGSTTAPDYVFDPSYGLGGGALVSQAMSGAQLGALVNRIRGGVLADAAVVPGAAPTVVMQKPDPETFLVFVGVQLVSGTTQTFSLAVSSAPASLQTELGQALLTETGQPLYTG